MSKTKNLLADHYVSVYKKDFPDHSARVVPLGTETTYSKQAIEPLQTKESGEKAYKITTYFKEKHPPWMPVHSGYRNNVNRYLANLRHAPVNIQFETYPSLLNVAPKSYQWPYDAITGKVPPMHVNQKRPKPFGEDEVYVNNLYTLQESRRGIVDYRFCEAGLRKDRALQALHESTPLYKLGTKP